MMLFAGPRRGREAWVALPLVSLFAACSVPATEAASTPTVAENTCSRDSDCNPGVCGAGRCVAAGTDLDPLILEVVPPASSHFGAGDSFLVEIDNPSDRSRSTARDITLPRYATVEARLVFEPQVWDVLSSTPECDQVRGPDGSMGVQVSVSRSGRPAGLPIWSSVATAKSGDGGWEFKLSLPADSYDLYLTLLNGCMLPPVWLRNVQFDSGTYSHPAFKVPSLAELSGKILLDDSVSLKDWTIRLIEPTGGLPISTVDEPLENFLLYYVPPGAGVTPLVQVAPPQGVVAPTVLWDLSVVDLDNDGKVGLDLSHLTWSVTTVRARVEREASSQGMAGATVVLRSKRLAGAPEGLTASWETTVRSNAEGDIEAQLVPGDYQVIVTPESAADAMTEHTWTVASEPAVQAGRVLTVRSARRLTGIAVEPQGGSPLSSSPAEIVPIAPTPGMLEIALGAAASSPRSLTAETGSSGEFLLPVDPGLVALLVRTPEESGFPWLVRSGIEVEVGGTADLDLGTLSATYPVMIEGTLRDPDGNLVQRARLRAFGLVGAKGGVVAKGEAARRALQVAETRSNESGRFRLLLPASVR